MPGTQRERRRRYQFLCDPEGPCTWPRAGEGHILEAPMMRFARFHFRRHVRFYTAASLGIVVAIAAARFFPQLEIVLGADTFFVTYLVFMTILVVHATPEKLRKLADVEDEGIVLIVFIALTAICLSLASLFLLLNQRPKPDAVQLFFTLASAPLGWLTLHTIAALYYAHRYFASSPLAGAGGAVGG